MNDGSICPCSIFSHNNFPYRWTCVCPLLIVKPLFIKAPKGSLSGKPTYTPGIEMVPAFRQQKIASRNAFAQVRAVSNLVERRNRESWKLAEAIHNLSVETLRIISNA